MVQYIARLIEPPENLPLHQLLRRPHIYKDIRTETPTRFSTKCSTNSASSTSLPTMPVLRIEVPQRRQQEVIKPRHRVGWFFATESLNQVGSRSSLRGETEGNKEADSRGQGGSMKIHWRKQKKNS